MINNDSKLPSFAKLVIQAQLDKGLKRGNNIPEPWNKIEYLTLVDEALGRIQDNNLESALCFLAMAAAQKYNVEFRRQERKESIARLGFTLGLETFGEALNAKKNQWDVFYDYKTFKQELAADAISILGITTSNIREVMGEDWWNLQVKKEEEFFEARAREFDSINSAKGQQ